MVEIKIGCWVLLWGISFSFCIFQIGLGIVLQTVFVAEEVKELSDNHENVVHNKQYGEYESDDDCGLGDLNLLLCGELEMVELQNCNAEKSHWEQYLKYAAGDQMEKEPIRPISYG